MHVIGEEFGLDDLDWFAQQKRVQVSEPFETTTPNFFYRNAKITAMYTADMDMLKSLLPVSQVRPVAAWKGRGFVALTGFCDKICDNDPYNEFSIAIATTEPDRVHLGPLTLLKYLRSNTAWGYVLKLPVNTEIAEARGVLGYNLPKWVCPIDYREDTSKATFQVTDAATGATDLTMIGDVLDCPDAAPMIERANFVNLDHDGVATTGYCLSRLVRAAKSTNAESASLELGIGPLSDLIRQLKLGRLLSYNYVPEYQIAQHLPKPLSA